jgi:hypothetical protein
MSAKHREFVLSNSFINTKLYIIAKDLKDIATKTDTRISLEEA